MIYEYKCFDCDYKFEKDLLVEDCYKKIKCPKCGKYAIKIYKSVNVDESTIRRGSKKI